ncbi:MATE family efflux transporter [Sporanaerobium hydrogeniformans]|uniref:MATE family efflux transporter n=1 Tax=Sporanaerobium hydrogeniformans TaxID=3072179 RepID=A0AC61DE14_9FIRM|nr:MATE family efflux transporter [Sporanaerobium hydrogeniformans]PHV70847.1 MATE family efflux transporter [Sporanaerobium hydrogeniformans]
METTIGLDTQPIGRLFIKYTIPSIIGMLFFSIYIVIDGIFVGRVVGGSGLAAINIAMPFFSIAMAISIMLSAGASTVVGIELGQGKLKEASQSFSLAFYTLMLVSISVGIVTLLFLEPIAIILGATPELLSMVKVYLVILCLSTPVFTGGGLLSSGIRAMGKPNYAMAVMIVGSVLNIVFDYVLVVEWHWGVAGAALASGFAFAISFGVGLVPYFLKGSVLHFTKCKLDFKKVGRFFYNGSSEALTEVAVAFSTYIFNIVLLNHIGEQGVSAFSIISYISSLLIAVLLGIATGMQPIISFNYGAGKGRRIIHLNRLGIKVVAIVGIACTIGMFIYGETLINFFAPNDPELIQMTNEATRLYSLAFLINGINILASAYFTALEEAKLSAIISLLRGIVFVLIGIIFLPPILGNAGIWLTVFFSEVLTLVITLKLIRKSYNELVDNIK